MLTPFEEMISRLPRKLLQKAVINDNSISLATNFDKNILFDRCKEQINTDGVTKLFGDVSPPSITPEKAIYAYLLSKETAAL